MRCAEHPNFVLLSSKKPCICVAIGACLVAQWKRIRLLMQETWVQSLEKEMATHSSILAWRIPGTEEPSGLPSMGSHRVDMTEVT